MANVSSDKIVYANHGNCPTRDGWLLGPSKVTEIVNMAQKKARMKHSVVLEEQIKHILYDMLLLAMAVRYVDTKWPEKYRNKKFGPDEMAKQTALAKFRSLEKFLFGKKGKDDIQLLPFIEQGLCSAPSPESQEFHKFGEAVANTYALHLVKNRTVRKVKLPRRGQILLHSRALLSKCKQFVEQCIEAGLDLKYDKGWADAYWMAFQEECKNLKI